MTMTIDQFIQTYNGSTVDVDGFYGGQCWDLWSRYAQDVAGVPQSATNTVNNLAGSVYTSTWDQQPALRDKFDRLPAGTVPRKGDVAFWGNAPATPDTHVAIVIADQGGSLLCLTQNPGATHQARHHQGRPARLPATQDRRPGRAERHRRRVARQRGQAQRARAAEHRRPDRGPVFGRPDRQPRRLDRPRGRLRLGPLHRSRQRTTPLHRTGPGRYHRLSDALNHRPRVTRQA